MPMLSPERWEQVRTAFEEIVDLDPPRRTRRLKTIGEKDPTLRLTLEALLQADARANDWLAPVESPLGFVPPPTEGSVRPNVDGLPSLTRRRWLVIAAGGVALGVGGIALVNDIAQRAAKANAGWRAPPPQPVTAGSSYSLVGVNLRGEERSFGDVAKTAGSRRASVLDTAYFAWPRVSPDGQRIAVEVATDNGRWDIWVYDLPSRSLTRLTRNFTGAKPFGWSSDSRNLVYLAVDDQEIGWTNRIVSKQWDGGGPPRQLLRTEFPILNVALGPLDGEAIIRGLGGNDDLWIGPLRDRGALRPFFVTNALELDLRLSRDGQLLAYASNETGQFEIYVLALSDPSIRVQVSRGGGTQPVWSPDGRRLFYRSPDRMMRATVKRGEPLTVEQVEPLFADIYERHDVTNYDVLPSGNELVMIRARSR